MSVVRLSGRRRRAAAGAEPLGYESLFAAAMRGEECEVHGMASGPCPLPIARWSRSAGRGDHALLAHCVGPTLDIGCGPGRMAEALAHAGHPVLGVDLVAEAVVQTRARGVAALERNVFDPLPAEGRWSTALLADGNIGIGGNPRALLRRAAALIDPAGRVVVDLAPPGSGSQVHELRLRSRSRWSDSFPWAVVGAEAIGTVAAGTGLRVEGVHQAGNRWFAVLQGTGR